MRKVASAPLEAVLLQAVRKAAATPGTPMAAAQERSTESAANCLRKPVSASPQLNVHVGPRAKPGADCTFSAAYRAGRQTPEIVTSCGVIGVCARLPQARAILMESPRS